MESRPKGYEECSLSADAMPDGVGIPCTLKHDSMPSPSVLDKNNLNRKFDLGYFWWSIKDFAIGNISRLAAYERARRALRRECELFSWLRLRKQGRVGLDAPPRKQKATLLGGVFVVEHQGLEPWTDRL